MSKGRSGKRWAREASRQPSWIYSWGERGRVWIGWEVVDATLCCIDMNLYSSGAGRSPFSLSLSLSLSLSRCPCIAFDLLPPFLFLFSSFPDPYTPPSRYTPSVPLFLLGKVYVKIHRVSPRSVRRVASAIVSKATRRHFEYKKALPPDRSAIDLTIFSLSRSYSFAGSREWNTYSLYSLIRAFSSSPV